MRRWCLVGKKWTSCFLLSSVHTELLLCCIFEKKKSISLADVIFYGKIKFFLFPYYDFLLSNVGTSGYYIKYAYISYVFKSTFM